ncbi:GNAT family N-acetyltransferase [Chitinilyticum litopenaei]|uniref:GNAT family N-acetyltransferase n=1 Tax=Chitinilyticum litopenaei TaxID=1121276 RepID=UPI00040DB003|nr:GNAT family N-acetyltransferase [Chitinilyticum litopenaei]
MPITIRPITATDWPAVWPILQQTFASGDSYPFPPDSSEADIRHAWLDVPQQTFVACAEDGAIVGTYYIKPNQTGLGSHVCNCGYVVAPAASGRGIATTMCVHSQATALALGFRAMQFNLVVATNTRAVRLWRHLGFEQVGVLPGAFRHARLGYVDALVLFKTLSPQEVKV